MWVGKAREINSWIRFSPLSSSIMKSLEQKHKSIVDRKAITFEPGIDLMVLEETMYVDRTL